MRLLLDAWSRERISGWFSLPYEMVAGAGTEGADRHVWRCQKSNTHPYRDLQGWLH